MKNCKTNHRVFWELLLGAVMFFPALSARATDFSSTNFVVRDPVITVSGGSSASTSFQNIGSAGQPAIGISTSTSFVLKAGFLYFTASTATTPAPSSGGAGGGTGASAGSGGGGGGTGFLAAGMVPAVRFPQVSLACLDFNRDTRINLSDLSILLYHYDQRVQNIGCYYVIRSGVVGFADVSVLMYYWTG